MVSTCLKDKEGFHFSYLQDLLSEVLDKRLERQERASDHYSCALFAATLHLRMVGIRGSRLLCRQETRLDRKQRARNIRQTLERLEGCEAM